MVIGFDWSDTRRGTGEDDVALVEGEVFACVGDYLVDFEVHVGWAVVLPSLVVEL